MTPLHARPPLEAARARNAVRIAPFTLYSLRTKLIVTFLAVALIPLGVLGFFNDRVTRRTLTDNANRSLYASASQAATRIDDFINASLGAIGAEAQLPVLGEYLNLPANLRTGNPNEGAVLAFLFTLKNKELRNSLAPERPQYIHSYALLDKRGRVVLSTHSAEVGLDQSDRDYFQEPLISRRPYVSPIEYPPATNEASLYFAAPVYDPNVQLIGVLVARYDAALLQQLVAPYNGLAGSESFGVLFDENHFQLAHGTAPETLFTTIARFDPTYFAQLQTAGRLPNRPTAELFLEAPDLEQNLSAAVTQTYFSVRAVATGSQVNRVAVVRLQTQPWLMAFFQPQQVFLAPAEAQTRATLLLGLAVAGGVAVAALFVAQQLSGPIVRLTAATTKVAQGDLLAHARVESNDEIGTLANAFNTMTAQLRETLEGLEYRVATRTKALAASAEVSRRISTLLDQKQLVLEVAEQVKRAFNYYHVHVYLFDEGREELVMVGGTGEAGQTMLARGHRLARGRGLVGRAAETNSAVLVPDVSKAVGWLSNPLLPETQAEVAVPIAVGGLVLGVLDVQHNAVGGLTSEDAELIQSIANQLAIALQNAQSYRQTQQQADLEMLINAIGQKIQSASTVESALQVAAREVGRAVGAERTRVRLHPARIGTGPFSRENLR